MRSSKKGKWFGNLAKTTSQLAGRPSAFMAATAVILVWMITGPFFGFSDTWQLVINTGTTIVTFLMVFLIQNTQNRDTEALQVKLDELIRVTQGAHNALLNLEELEEPELNRIRAEYTRLAEQARAQLKQGKVDTGAPEVREKRDMEEQTKKKQQEKTSGSDRK
jgi:low affinity Fe/Cu permease